MNHANDGHLSPANSARAEPYHAQLPQGREVLICDNVTHSLATPPVDRPLPMNMHTSVLLACLSVAASGFTSFIGRGQGLPQQVANRDELRIEFPHPDDWRCANEHGCIVCWNIAEEPSYVVIHYASGVEPERRKVAAGQTVEVCPDDVQDAIADFFARDGSGLI